MLHSFIQKVFKYHCGTPNTTLGQCKYMKPECSTTKPTYNLDAQRFLWVQKLCYHECPENISFVFPVKLFTNKTSSLLNTYAEALVSAQNIARCALCSPALDPALATAYLPARVQASRVGEIF